MIGGAALGRRWKRPDDKAGLALISNGLTGPHREYLALGGTGITLGDGSLNYRRESIVEIYYTCHLWRGVYVGPDISSSKTQVTIKTAALCQSSVFASMQTSSAQEDSFAKNDHVFHRCQFCTACHFSQKKYNPESHTQAYTLKLYEQSGR